MTTVRFDDYENRAVGNRPKAAKDKSISLNMEIRYRKFENAFVWIKDLTKAPTLEYEGNLAYAVKPGGEWRIEEPEHEIEVNYTGEQTDRGRP